MKRIYLLIVFCFIYFQSFCQLNIQFRSQLTYPGISLANIWGYVDSLGNEYALVGTSTGVSIVDVTNANQPVQVYTVVGTTSQWREIKTWGKYAYVTTEGCCLGLQIIDLSNLPGPVTSSYWTGSGAIAGLLQRSHSLHIDNGYLYLNGSNLFGGACIIASLSNPTNPAYMSNTSLNFTGNIRYVHDCYVRNDTLFGANIYAGMFTIINVANKSTPVLINTQNTTNNFTHNCWLTDDGRTLLTTDETSNSYLTAYDISNPANITYLDKVQSNPGSSSIVHNTYVLNDYAINSWYKDGLTIVDVSRPQNLIITGNYDTYTQGSGNGFSGCWGVYPYLPSGNIIASDINNGLFVLTPTYVRACYLEGNVINSCTGTGLSAVTVHITGGTTDASTITGSYKTGMAVSGNYTVTFSKTGYNNAVFNNVSLTNGVITNLNVALVPINGISSVNPVVTDVLCNGQFTGQILTSPTGGVLPLTYSWSDGSTNQSLISVAAGTYTVTVTDAGGCTLTSSSTITEPAAISLNATGNSPLCKGASLNLTSTSGFSLYSWTGPGSFSSSDQNPTLMSVDGSNSGLYTLVVTNANGCTTSKSFAVQVSDMSITGVITHIPCYQQNTGAVDVSVSGGIGTYTYLWNNNATTEDLTNRYQNTYKVTVTDAAGCTKTAKFDVLNLAPSALAVSTTKTNVRCFGANTGKATLLPSGGLPPYSYTWNTVPVVTTAVILNLGAGTYTATITDAAGCVKLRTITITQPPQIICNLTQSNVTVFGGNNGSINLAVSGGVPPYQYQWNTFPVQTTANISSLTSGYYKCKITDAKNCLLHVSTTISQPPPPNIKISPPSGLQVLVYPNPVHDRLYLKGLSSDGSCLLILTDLRGRQILKLFADQKDMVLNLTGIEPGLYFLEICNRQNKIVNRIIRL